jgi:hypothetical protein
MVSKLGGKMRKVIETLLGARMRSIITSIIGFIFGVLAQPLLESKTQPLLAPANIPLLVFMLTIVLYAVFIAVWGHTSKQITAIADNISIMARYAGPRVRVLSQLQGYKVVRERTKKATTEILKLIYYQVDWESGEPAYDPEMIEGDERRNTYELERRKLKQEKGKHRFRYVEILQIPYKRTLQDILPHDPIYKESSEFLVGLNKSEPEFASLRISEVIFPNTFIIIDRSFLYVAFETKNPDRNTYQYPFLAIVIEDPDAEVIRQMLQLFQRIESNSELVTS